MLKLIRRPMTEKYNTTQQVNIENSETFVHNCAWEFSMIISLVTIAACPRCYCYLLIFGWFISLAHNIYVSYLFFLTRLKFIVRTNFLPFVSYTCVVDVFHIYVFYFQYFSLVMLLCGPELLVAKNSSIFTN